MLLTNIQSASFDGFKDALMRLDRYIDDADVSEIMINNPDSIWIERKGCMEQLDETLSGSQVRAAIKYLATGVGMREATAGTSSGILNASYESLRIAAVMQPTAIDGDAICIRKHNNSEFSAQEYINFGSFDRQKINEAKHKSRILVDPNSDLQNAELVEFIANEIYNRKNFLIAGGTSAGKTSLLNMFLGYIPKEQRLITIEDTAELKVKVPNRVRLLSNKSQGVTAQLLVELCLRMRPDRIILGELRSSEALDFLQAINTGHDGGFASLHAKDATMTLARLESLVSRGLPAGVTLSNDAIRRDIADGIDYVIHFKKASGSSYRFMNEMIQIDGYENGEFIIKKIF